MDRLNFNISNFGAFFLATVGHNMLTSLWMNANYWKKKQKPNLIAIAITKMIIVSIIYCSMHEKIVKSLNFSANETIKSDERKRKISAKSTDAIDTNNTGRSGNSSGFPLSNSTNRESW